MNTITTLQAVLFDMDGLMFNSEEIYYASSEEVARRRGKVYTKEIDRMIMGTSTEFSMNTIIRELGLTDTWQALGDETQDVFRSLLPTMLKPMPGLMELLDFLDENNIPHAIATSTNRELMEYTLSIYNLEPRFAKTITGSDITHCKPNPEIYLKAAAALGVAPENCMVLEDSSNGCRAGKNAGTYVVAVPAEHSQGQDFSFVDFVADTLADPGIRQRLLAR
ncbi:MAG: HAD family phosphatase [Thermoguttaceae bacterium]|nr:HAD family phosphatase [Thermoguttaceae bacterium]